VLILKPGAANGLRDPSDVCSVNGEVNVFRKPGARRIPRLYVEKYGQAPNDSIVDSRGLQSVTDSFGDFSQLFQVTIVCLK